VLGAIRFASSPQVRTARDDDGLVLLDLRTGRYSTFNAVGALVWSQIEAGASAEEIIRHLQERFEAPPEVIARDVTAILATLEQNRLIVRDGGGARSAPPAAAGLETAGPGASVPADATDGGDLAGAAREPAPGGFGGGLVRTGVAFLTLVYMDLLLKLFRFPRLHAAVRRPVAAGRRVEPATVAGICRAVDRAAGFYFKRAWCLQRSAACVHLLRRRGCPARLVLGVRTFPFEAHAWAEVDGRVVNDRPDFIRRFRVLDRL
jgi:hypothetical protein